MLELGEVDGEINAALGAGEAGEAVGNVEDGLATGAGELDLGRIDAPGLRRRPSRRRRGHQLRRQHLRQLALGANEFCHPRRHGEDPVAPRAPDLAASRRRRRRLREGRGRRRPRGLPHSSRFLPPFYLSLLLGRIRRD